MSNKRLAKSNHRKRKELRLREKEKLIYPYYCGGAVVAIGVVGVIGYYVYQSKTPVNQHREAPVHRHKETPVN